jgi:hypothetical protein
MRDKSLGHITATLALAFLLAVGPIARADTAPTEAQVAAARELFIEAEKDEDAERWSDALEKLLRVSTIKLTPGIRYHTALCEEHLGHLLAALRDYKSAADQARTENAADVLRVVDKRMLDSQARIPQLVIVLLPSLPAATVQLDGRPISPGVPIPVDPGTHNVDAVAPGRVPSTVMVTLQERGSTSLEVRLDPQRPAPAEPVAHVAAEPAAGNPRADAPASTHESAWPPRPRTVAILATALGLAAVGTGAYVAAGIEHTHAVEACAATVSTEIGACDSRKNAVRAFDWIALGGWAGAAAVGTLAVLSLTKHHAEAGSIRPTHVAVGPASILLAGTF